MSEEQQPASVDVAAIEAKVRQQLESQFNEEKAKILQNRDQVLAEKKELESKFKGFNLDEEQLSAFQKYQKVIQTNELMRMAQEGNIVAIGEKLLASQRKAWGETQAEYEERIEKSQKYAEQKEQEANELAGKLTGLQKQTYLKSLTSDDESFKRENFNDFLELYSNRVAFDENGSAYAVEGGSPVIDANGDRVSFDEYYQKAKVKSGLFWKGGQGSGMKGGPADGSVKLKDMTFAERNELRKQLGDAKYAELLRKQ